MVFGDVLIGQSHLLGRTLGVRFGSENGKKASHILPTRVVTVGPVDEYVMR